MLDYLKYIEKAAYTTCRLNILDLVVLDRLSTNPTKWIYTSKSSCLQVQYLRDLSFDKVVKCFLRNLLGGSSGCGEGKGQVVCFQTDERGRSFVTLQNLLEYKMLQPRIASLQLFRSSQKTFEPFIYSFSLNVDSNAQSFHKIKIDKNPQVSTSLEGSYKRKLQDNVQILIRMIENVALRKVKYIEALYVISSVEGELWLVGCDSIELDTPITLFAQIYRSEPKKQKSISTVKTYESTEKKFIPADNLVLESKNCLHAEEGGKVKGNVRSEYKSWRTEKKLLLITRRRECSADLTNLAEYSIIGVPLKGDTRKYAMRKHKQNNLTICEKANLISDSQPGTSFVYTQNYWNIACKGKAVKSYQRAASKSASRIVKPVPIAQRTLCKRSYPRRKLDLPKPKSHSLRRHNVVEEYVRPKFSVFVRRASNFRCHTRLISRSRKLQV
eukprot:TRINITY_DN5999_c0_g1_i22.p1 TRINITY_DN5999_c0_g1~~TRINITY_DN5999_c0_g1_i22.p1  ORF type:complete len:442 (-),score=85.73 TRINITY_DN5999_c0_g1_i22:387-1712(-)